jgi:integrase/recombinase XerD
MSAEITSSHSAREKPVPERFDQKLAAPFIYKSVSEETRGAYARVIREFFSYVRGAHPSAVTPRHVLEFREHLTTKRRQSVRTVSLKLAVIRSFFEYLKAGGVVALNTAATKLVIPPALPTHQSGRALTPKEAIYLLSGPDRSKPEGARDYALLSVMLRLSLRVSEVCSLQVSSIKWSHGRWTLRCKVKGGREETWPLPKDLKEAIDAYLKLDRPRRATLHSDGPEAYLFQPVTNYRTLRFDKALSPRMVWHLVRRWGEFTGVGKISPHDLRRTAVTEALNQNMTYRQVQMRPEHKDINTIVRYDHARENMDLSAVNFLRYEKE